MLIPALTRDLQPAFAVLWWGTLINRLGSFVVPFLTLYLTQTRGFTITHAAWTVGLYGAGSFAASLIGGWAADRLGRKRTLVLGLSSGAGSVLALGLVPSAAWLPALTLLAGLCAELYRPAAAAYLADILSADQRVRAFTLQYWAINLGAAVGPVLAGVLTRYGFSLLFILDALTTLAYAVILVLALPGDAPRPELSSGVRHTTLPRRDNLHPHWLDAGPFCCCRAL